MTQADLARLRQALPHCELLALVDVSTEMTLAVDAAMWRAQENLDALCAQAARLLAGVDTQAQGCCWVVSPFGLTVFQALSAQGHEVLCMLLSPDADLQQVQDVLLSGRAGHLSAQPA